MKLKEQEINRMIAEAISEYGDNWNYPAGADYPGAPWYDTNTPTETVDEEWPFPTAPLLVSKALDADIEDQTQLAIIKQIASKMPEKLYLHGVFDVPYEWEDDGEGGSKNHDYDNSETLELDLCVKEGKGQYTPVMKWIETNHITDSQDELALIKKIVDEIELEFTEDNPIGAEDFYCGKWSSLVSTTNWLNKFVESGKFDAAGKEQQEPTTMNESEMRNYIYEAVKKMLDEKSVSKAQQRFMGMVRGVQTGEVDPDSVSDSVKDAAANMKKKDVKDFASTKHKGLPNHVKKAKKEE
jgi:hypothetical protein